MGGIIRSSRNVRICNFPKISERFSKISEKFRNFPKTFRSSYKTFTIVSRKIPKITEGSRIFPGNLRRRFGHIEINLDSFNNVKISCFRRERKPCNSLKFLFFLHLLLFNVFRCLTVLLQTLVTWKFLSNTAQMSKRYGDKFPSTWFRLFVFFEIFHSRFPNVFLSCQHQND